MTERRDAVERIVLIGANNPETRRMIVAISRVRNAVFEGFVDNDPAKIGRKFIGYDVLGPIAHLSTLERDI